MSVPKEPRQLMINLMYLVLTAMLALNVSSEILHAFKIINQSIGSSNSSIKDKNEKIYASFKTQLDQAATHDNIKPYFDKANEVKKASEDMMAYLETWKAKIITESGGYDDPEKKVIKGESNIDASTRLMVEEKGGDELRKKLVDLRNQLLSKINPADSASIGKQIPLSLAEVEKSEDNPTGDWKFGNFHNMPVMAAVTLLSKFQNDVRNSEAVILNKLNQEAGDVQLKFDEIRAIAITPNSYALAGQKIEAQILMAAYNKSVKPQVTQTGGSITKVENGVAYWETTASGVGLQTVKGSVSIDLGNRKESRPYEFTYMVGSTGGSIQLDKMNVFYIGVDNPITISAAGYSLEDVSLSFPDGEVKPAADGAKGHYLIGCNKVSPPEGSKVSIMAKTQTGEQKEITSLNVRVKKIPDPVARIALKAGGGLPASSFRVQTGVEAALVGFEFDTRFIITEYKLSISKKRDPDIKGGMVIKGPVWTENADAKKLIADLRPGDKVFIDDIKAKGPDGKIRALNPIFFNLN